MSAGSEWGQFYAKLRLQTSNDVSGENFIYLEKLLLESATETLLLEKKSDLHRISEELKESCAINGRPDRTKASDS
jgi:hypothetical protein